MRIRWRGLELPTRVVRDGAASTATYGRFFIEPFERGFGTTVGNSLRRILLSSLQGAAVTHVKIKGADHEFMSLPGFMQDVTEIILNVKSLVLKATSDEPKTMRLSVRGKSGKSIEVRASQIEADSTLEIVNKDQLLATLTDDVEFEMEMTVAQGRSYVTADENKPEGEDQIIGVIPVDSVFSPVGRVRYRVEDTRVGQRTNYDRLVMEIWTNGTVTPDMALVEAAKILRKHLNPFVQYFELGTGLAVEGAGRECGGGDGASAHGADASKLSLPVNALDLSVRSGNCLSSANINTIGELLSMDEGTLLKLRSFGRTSLREVKRKLADLGLSLTPSDSEPLDSDETPDDSETPETPLAGFAAPNVSGPAGIPPLDSGSMGTPPPQSFSSLPSPVAPLPPLTAPEDQKNVGTVRHEGESNAV